MAALQPMPQIQIPVGTLQSFGQTWTAMGGRLSRTPPNSSSDFGRVFDLAVGQALAVLLGNAPILTQINGNSLTPTIPDCVEVGPVRVVGGVRPQNFDVGYRPDGIRFAFDSKTLNDKKSVGKNWQNMINDLATEATTVHSRFPHAVVAFLLAIPSPCVTRATLAPIIQTMERLTGRVNVEDPDYRAEAISLVVWDPATGTIDNNLPASQSPLRLEKFSEQVEAAYVARYKGLPPHARV